MEARSYFDELFVDIDDNGTKNRRDEKWTIIFDSRSTKTEV